MFFLGVDLGTSALKAIIIDDDQSALGEASVALQTKSRRRGWSEQDPADWWDALNAAIRELRRTAPAALRKVRGLGLSGQMHGAVLVDRTGKIIRPAMLWNDSRAVSECALLQEAVPDLPHIAGIIAMPGFTAPKLLWLKRHEPDAFARIWKVFSAKDYLRLRLTGEAATEMSDAAGTLWLDQAARDWSEPILAASGLDRAQMPQLVEGTDPAGELTSEILTDWGVDGPVRLAGGAGDAAAAAIGIGAVENGDSFISLGTSAQYFVTDDRYDPRPETLLHAFAHALPARWYRMAAMLNGASCLDWVARLLGGNVAGLLAEVEAGYRCPSPVFFLPYLSGERTPHNDPAARGVFSGLAAGTSKQDLVQAVAEGVAFTLLEAQISLEAAGVRPGSVAAVGGGARSRFWMQIIADVLGRRVVRYVGAEKGPAFGAARLAIIVVTGQSAAEACAKPPVLDELTPRADFHSAYRQRLAGFQRLYRRLKPEFAKAASAT